MLKVTDEQRKDIFQGFKVDASLKVVMGKSKDTVHYLNQISNTTKTAFCKEVFMTIPVVVYTRQDFYLLNALNDRINELRASGLIDFWASLDIKRAENKPESPHPRTLKLEDFKGSFYIAIIGWVVGVSTLVCEFIVRSFYERS